MIYGEMAVKTEITQWYNGFTRKRKLKHWCTFFINENVVCVCEFLFWYFFKFSVYTVCPQIDFKRRKTFLLVTIF